MASTGSCSLLIGKPTIIKTILKINKRKHILATHSILTMFLMKVAMGDNIMEHLSTCTILPNPFMCIGIMIYIKSMYSVLRNLDSGILQFLWDMAVISAYTFLVMLTKNIENCDATITLPNILSGMFFLILSYYNPIAEFIMLLEKCSQNSNNNNKPKKRKPQCMQTISSHRRKDEPSSEKLTVIHPKLEKMYDSDSTVSYPSCMHTDARSVSRSTYNDLYRRCKSAVTSMHTRLDNHDEETQTSRQCISKCCQYPNTESVHFMRGQLPAQLLERRDLYNNKSKDLKEQCNMCSKILLSTESCANEKVMEKIDETVEEKQDVSVAEELKSKVVLGDPSGDYEEKPTEQRYNAPLISALLTQLQRNLAVPTAPRKHRTGVMMRKPEHNDIVRIEDLMEKPHSKNDEKETDGFQQRQPATFNVPDTPKVVPLQVASALQAIDQHQFQTVGVGTNSEISLRPTESMNFRTSIKM